MARRDWPTLVRIVLLLASCAAGPPPSDTNIQWTHRARLDTHGDVQLSWQPRHQEILFRIEAKTYGYVGLGFSPDGKMDGADIIIAWIDDRTLRPHLMDCHGAPKSQGSAPVRDLNNNYRLTRGIQNATHTIIEFRRALDTCDPDDYILTPDTVRVIWALHDVDPIPGAEMLYHNERRGVQSLHLLGPPPVPPAQDRSLRHWDVVLKDFEVGNDMDTVYWCKVFKAPTLNQKHHIVGFEPIIGAGHEGAVHHIILHECELNPKDDTKRWDDYAREDGRLCYGPTMVDEWERCPTPLVTWAVGSQGENLPKNVGLPLAPKTNSFYMLEIHFDNPGMKKMRDTSGLRLFYTSDLRPDEGGVFVAGIALSTLHFIPPYQKEYKTAGLCSTECTKKVFPKDGVKVVSVMLHSHLAGTKIRLRHIRAGKEMAPLAQDDHYDFNYQQARGLSQNAIILPGDFLVTECAYSTVNRHKPTLGGYSTKEEMCLAFVLHYPRTEFAGCYSMSPVKYFFETLGVREFYGKTMTEVEETILRGESENQLVKSSDTKPLFNYRPGDEMSPEANRRAIQALQNARDFTVDGETVEGATIFDKLIIREPPEFRNKTFMRHLEDIPYNETLLTKKMEEYFYTGLHMTFCRKRDDTLAIKENIEKFPNFTVYTNNENQIQCSYRTRIYHSNAVRIIFNCYLFLIVGLNLL